MTTHRRDHDELARLVRLAHEATVELSHQTSALQLYRDARDVAEQRVPGPLGEALAAVLAEEAHHRAATLPTTILGASKSMIALAVAVLSIVPDGEETDCGNSEPR